MAAPISLAVASETQGEAVAWFHDARGYITTSEGVAPPLNVARCR
jgi:hypothetical protein